MASQIYEVAHIREQGQEMIIIPVSNSVNNIGSTKQNELKSFLQDSSRSAGLVGEVCLVWEQGRNFYFLAPKQWHGFFKSINMRFVAQNINRKLTCSS